MTGHDRLILETITSRRSIRKFTEEPVPAELVERILEAGRWAPSGLNNQPWRFKIVDAGSDTQHLLASCTKYGQIIERAQKLIIVLLDKAQMYDKRKDYQSAGACIQNMLLAIHALNLGGVWLGEILNQEDQVLKILALPADQYELMAVIAFGHPAHQGASQRLPLTELILED